MMKAAVLLLLPLAVSAFSPLAGYTAKSSTIARNGLKSNLDWRSAEGDPEPEVRSVGSFSRIERWHRIESLAFHAALNTVKFNIFILLTFSHSFVPIFLLFTF